MCRLFWSGSGDTHLGDVVLARVFSQVGALVPEVANPLIAPATRQEETSDTSQSTFKSSILLDLASIQVMTTKVRAIGSEWRA